MSTDSDPRASSPLIALRNVARIYDDDAGTIALRSVDLVIEEGEYVAIVGPSGSGKSTLLNILGLLDQPTSGSYQLRGRDVHRARERDRNRLRARTFGFVFQASHVIGALTASSNVALGVEIAGVARPERIRKVTEALEMLGLMHRANTIAKVLSGGERQRVAVARAIATGPEVILADEPTGALDSVNSATVIDYLDQLNQHGVTVIIITHDASVAARAHRIIEIRDGVLSAASPPPDSSGSGAERFKGFPSSTEPVKSSPELRPTLAQRARTWLLELCSAISAHTTAPMRSLVLIFAFLLGAGGLVSALGISESAAAQVSERLTAAALDEVVVQDTLTGGADPLGSVTEIENRISALARVTNVGWSSMFAASDANVTILPPNSFVNQVIFDGRVAIVDSGYLAVSEARVTPSGVATLFSMGNESVLAIVGVDAARQLGVSTPGPGSRLWLDGYPVDVVGIVEPSARDPLLAASVLLSPAASAVLVGGDKRFTVRTEAGYPAAVAEALPLMINPANPGQVQTSTVADLRSLRTGVASDLGTLITVVSWILLALSTLSAGATMFVSVRARAPEIALRRALGASRPSIWRLFALEGLVIGIAGGTAGSVFGLFAVVVVCQIQQWTAVLSPSFLGVGVLAGAASGLVCAMYPALVAAFSNPAEAVRA